MAKEQEEKEKKNKKILLILLLLLLIFIALFIGIKIGSSHNKNNGGVNLTVDKDSKDKIEKKEKNETVTKGVSIPGWTDITLPANSTKAKVDFYNPEANKDLYYLTFQLIIIEKDGSQKVIYESKLVEPGKHIYDIKLGYKLTAGDYEGIVHVQPYRMKDKSQTNAADLKTNIKVR